MGSALPPGSLAYVQPVDQPAIGDIVTFQAPSDDWINHRITADWSGTGAGPWQTAGDANNAPDRDLVPTRAILGTVVAYVPILGWIANILALPAVMALLLLIALTVVVWPTIIGDQPERAPA